MPSEREHYNTSLQWQEWYDNILRKVGARPAEPTLGKTTNDYVRKRSPAIACAVSAITGIYRVASFVPFVAMTPYAGAILAPFP